MAILKDRKYLFCNFLLTSRPHRIGNVKEYSQTIVRVDGFTYYEAKTFASKRLNNNVAITKAVLRFNPTGANTDKEPLYRCPILLAFLCILSREEEIDLSIKTMGIGEIYTRMVRCLYKRFAIRRGTDFNNQSFMEIMRSIGKLAYKMLLSDNSLLKRSDVMRVVGGLAFEIGLLIGHEEFRLIQNETADIFVTFPHRSIQEFLGAFYFMLMLSEEESFECSENVSGKVSKRTNDSDVGTARSLRSILSDHDSFILKNSLFFRLCLWFLCNEQTYLPFQNNQLANSKLIYYIVDKVDVCQLDVLRMRCFFAQC